MRKPAAGHIYVLELSGGITKVGYTSSPAVRLAKLTFDVRQRGREILRNWISPRHAEAGLNEEVLIAECERLGGEHHGHEKAREWFSGLLFDDVVKAAEDLPMTACEGDEVASVQAARAEWSEILDRAQAGKPTHIMRYGNPSAVFVPFDWYERASRAIAAGG